MAEVRDRIPTNRLTVSLFEKMDYLIGNVEKKSFKHCEQPGCGRMIIARSIDFHGFIDFIAMKHGQPVLGIQTTSLTNHSGHKKKITTLRREEAAKWCLHGGKILLVSWFREMDKEKRPEWGKIRHYFAKCEEIYWDHENKDFTFFRHDQLPHKPECACHLCNGMVCGI